LKVEADGVGRRACPDLESPPGPFRYFNSSPEIIRLAVMMYVRFHLWRAVDHEGEVLESYVTRKRDKAAALSFMKKALKRHGMPGRL
jgi:hypothetical protein